MVYVTREGKNKEDAESLKGMIIGTMFPGEASGVKVSIFPWDSKWISNRGLKFPLISAVPS